MYIWFNHSLLYSGANRVTRVTRYCNNENNKDKLKLHLSQTFLCEHVQAKNMGFLKKIHYASNLNMYIQNSFNSLKVMGNAIYYTIYHKRRELRKLYRQTNVFCAQLIYLLENISWMATIIFQQLLYACAWQWGLCNKVSINEVKTFMGINYFL